MTFIIITMFGVVVVLIAGIVIMGIGGTVNKKYSNLLMRARVFLQLLAVGLLFLLFATG